jgi:hypothetical protein
VSSYVWFLTGKSSWVHTRSQGLFSTCCRQQILICCYKYCLGHVGVKTRQYGHGLCSFSSNMLLQDVTMYWPYLNLEWFQCMLLPLIPILFCNNLFVLWCMRWLLDYCNKWCVMLNHYDLGSLWFGLNPSWFHGLPELYGLKFENLIASAIIFGLVLL